MSSVHNFKNNVFFIFVLIINSYECIYFMNVYIYNRIISQSCELVLNSFLNFVFFGFF